MLKREIDENPESSKTLSKFLKEFSPLKCQRIFAFLKIHVQDFQLFSSFTGNLMPACDAEMKNSASHFLVKIRKQCTAQRKASHYTMFFFSLHIFFSSPWKWARRMNEVETKRKHRKGGRNKNIFVTSITFSLIFIFFCKTTKFL